MATPVANAETKLTQDVAGFQVAERGRNFIKHIVSDSKLAAPESYCLHQSMAPMHYDDGGYWRPIDTTLSAASARVGADIGQRGAGYEAHFNLSLSAPWTAEYRKGARAIRFKPVRLQSGTKKWLIDQSVTGLVIGDKIRWANAFGAGIHLEWSARPAVFAKNVIIDKPLTLTADLDLVIEVQVENLALPGLTPAKFLALGEGNSLRWPITVDAYGEQVEGKLLLSTAGGKRYLTHRVPRAWLEAATYPVAIDYVMYDYYLSYAVGASADDVFCYFRDTDSTWQLGTTSAFRFGSLATGQYRAGSAARFTNVQLPRGATMGPPYGSNIMITCMTGSYATNAYCYFRCVAADDAPQITTTGEFLTAAYGGTQVLTTASDSYDAPQWVFGLAYGPTNLNPVFQEVISRDGWREGNALIVYVDDMDNRSTLGAMRYGASWDHATLDAPYLRLWYSLDDYGQVF